LKAGNELGHHFVDDTVHDRLEVAHARWTTFSNATRLGHVVVVDGLAGQVCVLEVFIGDIVVRAVVDGGGISGQSGLALGHAAPRRAQARRVRGGGRVHAGIAALTHAHRGCLQVVSAGWAARVERRRTVARREITAVALGALRRHLQRLNAGAAV
jgi:hypothetical protein